MGLRACPCAVEMVFATLPEEDAPLDMVGKLPIDNDSVEYLSVGLLRGLETQIRFNT